MSDYKPTLNLPKTAFAMKANLAQRDHKTFSQKYRDYAAKQVEGQKETFIRLGAFGDCGAPYLTMNYGFEANIVGAQGNIIDNGHLHGGFKPVYWSVVVGSALVEAAVEYQEKTSFFSM